MTLVKNETLEQVGNLRPGWRCTDAIVQSNSFAVECLILKYVEIKSNLSYSKTSLCILR